MSQFAWVCRLKLVAGYIFDAAVRKDSHTPVFNPAAARPPWQLPVVDFHGPTGAQRVQSRSGYLWMKLRLWITVRSGLQRAQDDRIARAMSARVAQIG